MVAVPTDTPVTTPLDTPAAATDGALLVHVPPVVGSDSVEELPLQITVLPVIGGGAARNVKGWLAVTALAPLVAHVTRVR